MERSCENCNMRRYAVTVDSSICVRRGTYRDHKLEAASNILPYNPQPKMIDGCDHPDQFDATEPKKVEKEFVDLADYESPFG